MAQMNMIQALNSAMDIMLARDPNVVMLGEDIGYFGGVFRVTDGLQRKYGEHRVLDTPIAEGAIVGAAIGMGVNGLRPVAEVQFADYIYPACDQIFSELARLRYRSAGDFWAPVTIRTPCGGGIRGGQTHSQSPEGIFTHVCGIKVVMPSTPYDAKGLLIASIEDDDPVVFFEPKRLYNGPFDGDANKPAVPWSTHPKGEVPDGYYTVPIGKAEVVRKGSCGHDGRVRHHDLRMRGRGQGARHRRGNHRRALDGAAGHRHDLHVGQEDRSLPDRARSDALLRFRRRTFGDDPGRVLLGPRGADRPRRRLGHALSARVRMGVLPRSAARGCGPEGRDGGRMTRYVFKMPDLGEGTVEAEVVAWHIKVGDMVQEDQVMAEVMTDKAAVEVPAPVSGKVVTINGQPGDMVRVGSELVVFETEAADDDVVAPAAAVPATPSVQLPEVQPSPVAPATSPAQADRGDE